MLPMSLPTSPPAGVPSIPAGSDSGWSGTAWSGGVAEFIALVADVLARTAPESEPTPKEMDAEAEAALDSGSEAKKLVASAVSGWSLVFPSGLAAGEEAAEGDGSSPVDEDLADAVSGLGNASGAAWLDAATARHKTGKPAREEEKSSGDWDAASKTPSVFETIPVLTAARAEADSPRNDEEASAQTAPAQMVEIARPLGVEILSAADMTTPSHPSSHPMAVATITLAPAAVEAVPVSPREAANGAHALEPHPGRALGHQQAATAGPPRSVSLAPVAIELRLVGAARTIAAEVPREVEGDAGAAAAPLPILNTASSKPDSADAPFGRVPESLAGADLGRKPGGGAEAGQQNPGDNSDPRQAKPGEWIEVRSGAGRRDREEPRLREHLASAVDTHLNPAAHHEERAIAAAPMTAPPRVESPAPEWRAPKAVTEVHLDPRFELNERAGAKTGPIELRIDVPHAGDSPVQLHLREHRGEIQLAVRTADADLSQSLQEGLPDLIQRLEGQRADSPRTDHLPVDGKGLEGNFEARVTPGSALDLGSQDAPGENRRDGHPEQRSGERDSSGGQRRSDADPQSGRPRNEARWLEAWRRSFLNPTKKESQ